MAAGGGANGVPCVCVCVRAGRRGREDVIETLVVRIPLCAVDEYVGKCRCVVIWL